MKFHARAVWGFPRFVRLGQPDAPADRNLTSHHLSRKHGTIENAQAIAAHESPKTTKLYDRTNDDIILDETERIVI
jgi:hypothetical protein